MIITYQKKLVGSRVGIVFGTFAPLHQGHLDVIMRAKKENDGGCIVFVDGRDGDRGGERLPLPLRYRLVREYFDDDDLVAVYPIDETNLGIEEYPNGWNKFLLEVNRIMSEASEGKFVFYVSEEEYASHLLELGYDVVMLDRTENPISATMIRENPIKYWDMIAQPFRQVFSTNILICGTASEGKTTLVKDLGKYFNAPYTLEYAREYMDEHHISEWEIDGTDYFAFLNGQYQQIKKMVNSPSNRGVCFADTDSMVTRMYAEYYCKDPDLALTEEESKDIAVAADAITKKCKWNKIYLLCPKGVFVDDHTRYMAFSGMEERQALFTILCNNIRESGNWDKVTILSEGYWGNFKHIVDDVKQMMSRSFVYENK